jgi:hypothetical protein
MRPVVTAQAQHQRPLHQGAGAGVTQPSSASAHGSGNQSVSRSKQLTMMLPLGPSSGDRAADDTSRLELLVRSLAKFFAIVDIAAVLVVTPGALSAAHLPSFAVLTETCLCNVCACREIERGQRAGRARRRRGTGCAGAAGAAPGLGRGCVRADGQGHRALGRGAGPRDRAARAAGPQPRLRLHEAADPQAGCRGSRADRLVPSPRHVTHDQRSGLAEIYLHFAMPVRIILIARRRYLTLDADVLCVVSGRRHVLRPD